MNILKMHLAFLLLPLAAAATLFLSSRFGSGTTPDSIAYIAGARSLLLGQGFSFPDGAVPITIFPPLFSATLAAIGVIGIDPLDGARLLNAVLFALNGYLAALLMWRATGRMVAGIIAAAISLISLPLITAHSMVWSEPLFLFLILLTALLLTRYFAAPSYASLILPTATAVLAPLCRYAGVSLILAAAISVARKNVRHAAILIFAGSLGFVGWLVRNYLMTADLINKKVNFHPPTAAHFENASDAILEWFGGLPVAALFSILLAFTVFSRRANVEIQRECGTFLLNFAVIYLGILVLSISFIDSSLSFDRRLLSPVFLTAALYAVTWVAVHAHARSLRLAWAGMLLILLTVNSWAVIGWLDTLSTQGFGFSNVQWRQSPTVGYLKKTNRNTRIYTNAPDSVYLLADVPASMFPRHTDPMTRQLNPEYERQLSRIPKGALVAYFRAVTWRWYLPTEDRLRQELGLELVAELGDGAIYRISLPGRVLR